MNGLPPLSAEVQGAALLAAVVLMVLWYSRWKRKKWPEFKEAWTAGSVVLMLLGAIEIISGMASPAAWVPTPTQAVLLVVMAATLVAEAFRLFWEQIWHSQAHDPGQTKDLAPGAAAPVPVTDADSTAGEKSGVKK